MFEQQSASPWQEAPTARHTVQAPSQSSSLQSTKPSQSSSIPSVQADSKAGGALRYDPERDAFVLRGMVPGLQRKRLTRLGGDAAGSVTWLVVSARLRAVLEAAARHPGAWHALPAEEGWVDCRWDAVDPGDAAHTG